MENIKELDSNFSLLNTNDVFTAIKESSETYKELSIIFYNDWVNLKVQ